MLKIVTMNNKQHISTIIKTVYYHDTDAGGVVYYGNYLKYLEESRTEYLKEKGLDTKELHKQGFLYAVRNCVIKYKYPARYADILLCTAELTKIKAAQLIFKQTIFDEKKERIYVEAEVSLVSLNNSFKPTVIPHTIRKKLETQIN